MSTDRAYSDILADFAAGLGLSRPAAQCLAHLHQSGEPCSAEDLCAALGLSRSNVSVSLKELRGLRLVAERRMTGTRKEFYAPLTDPWETLQLLLAAHASRTLTPLAALLGASAPANTAASALARAMAAAARHASDLAALPPRDLARIATGPLVPTKKKKHKT